MLKSVASVSKIQMTFGKEQTMSKDIIYREDAIKAINAKTNWYQVTCNGKQIAVMLMAKDVNEILEKVPPTDRPQGEWKHLKGDEWLCPECGHVIWTEGSWEHPLERGKFYCENCGARMKGADDE